jgi:hypothetical protein
VSKFSEDYLLISRATIKNVIKDIEVGLCVKPGENNKALMRAIENLEREQKQLITMEVKE